MGTMKEVIFWPFEKGLFWEHFHSRQVPCAGITFMCTCLLTLQGHLGQAFQQLFWSRTVVSTHLILPWLPSDLLFPSGMALSLPEVKPGTGKHCIAGTWCKAEGACSNAVCSFGDIWFLTLPFPALLKWQFFQPTALSRCWSSCHLCPSVVGWPSCWWCRQS